MAKLQILTGPQVSQTVTIPDEGLFIIGRDETADLTLIADKISRKHCAINPTTRGFVLTDLASKNGTFVNGQPSVSQTLHSGDRIRIAEIVIKFLQEEETLVDATKCSETETDILTSAKRVVRRCDACDSGITFSMLSDGEARRVGSAILCPDCVRRTEALDLHGIVAVEEIRRLLGFDDIPVNETEADAAYDQPIVTDEDDEQKYRDSRRKRF